MKKIFLFILVLFSALNSYSQQWFPANAEWYNWYGNFVESGFTKFSVGLDTIVNGTNCKKIIEFTSIIHYPSNNINSGTGFELMYEQGGVVFIYVPSVADFDTLYNFAGVPGTKWNLYNQCVDSSFIEVIDTGHMNINSQLLKWMTVKYQNTVYENMNPDTLIEKIGCRSFGFLYPYICTTDPSEGFCSYQDLSVGLFPSAAIHCDSLYLYNSVNEIQTVNLISISPNPANEKLFIHSSKQNASASIQLFNRTGQLVFENKNFSTESIDTKNLQNGFYVLKYSNDGNYEVKKFLIQH